MFTSELSLSSLGKYWPLLKEATREYVVGFISDTVVKVLVRAPPKPVPASPRGKRRHAS